VALQNPRQTLTVTGGVPYPVFGIGAIGVSASETTPSTGQDDSDSRQLMQSGAVL
jgi:hypothetical protein